MRIITRVGEMLAENITASKKRTLIPTMGNLHEGHISLIEQAKTLDTEIIVSIFVNPAQFSEGEDLDTYPRTLDADIQKLKTVGIDILFTPQPHELYPFGMENFSYVHTPSLDRTLCSLSRPAFFKGVATIVTKLLNITRPHYAIFGDKDFQQLAVIRRMCLELFIPTTILSSPTIREKSGLALSSRNSYLSKSEHLIAPKLYEVLTQAKQDIERSPGRANDRQYLNSLEEHAKLALTEYGFKIDYFSIVSIESLLELPANQLVIAAAAYLGPTRLIDNIQLKLSEKLLTLNILKK